jgi:hypothetical protein
MKTDWKRFTSPDEVRAAIERRVPAGSPESDLRRFAQSEGFVCSERTDDIIYCSVEASTKLPLTAAKWLIRFHVPSGRLDRVEVDLGLTGP